MGNPFTSSELRHRIYIYILVRYVYVLAISVPGIVSLYARNGFDDQTRVNLLITVSVLIINTFLILANRIVIEKPTYYSILASVQLAFDVIFMTAVFQFNGGIESPLVMLYCIPIIMSGTLLDRDAAITTGIVSALIFTTFALMDLLQILHPANTDAPILHTSTMLPTLTIATSTLLVISAVVEFSSRLIRQRSLVKAELESALVEKAKNDAIIQSVGSALVVLDKNDKITMVNEAFERLSGWLANEAMEQSVFDVIRLNDQSGHETKDINRAITASHSQAVTRHSMYIMNDVFMKRKDDSTFPFLGHITPIINKEEVIGVTIVFDDASSIKEVQQLKNNFIALASHQLKTPIGEIKNYTESLLEGTLGDLTKKQTKYLDNVKSIAERCNQLISYLLDLSILEHGELRAHIQIVDAKEILRKLSKIHQKQADKNGIPIRIIADKHVPMLADPTMLTEVISSLIQNAILHSESSDSIELRAGIKKGLGFIEVADEGKGLDVEHLHEIFNKDLVLSGGAEAKNTGLGLYLAYEFTKLQNGMLSARHNEEAGKGTIFRVELPVDYIQKEN